MEELVLQMEVEAEEGYQRKREGEEVVVEVEEHQLLVQQEEEVQVEYLVEDVEGGRTSCVLEVVEEQHEGFSVEVEAYLVVVVEEAEEGRV